MNGLKIKQLREQKNYTQDYVAEKLGVSQNAYSRLENGQIKLSVEKAEKLSTILEVPIWEIISSELPTFQVSHAQNQKVAYNFYEYQKETFELTIQVLKDEIAVLREEKKTLLSLVERLTLK